MPKISVIIPVYGVEKYIERCAISLFEQTLDDIEFIFVDDCTPDRSMEILGQIIERYRLRFSKKNYVVRIERMLTNSGLPAVRKHGTKLATGDYIIHCDSDDWVDVTMYEKLYNKIIADSSDIVVCGYQETDGDKVIKQLNCSFTSKNEFISNMLYMKNSWAVWNKIYKKELYEDLEFPKYSMGEDMLITFQLVIKAHKISFVNEILYNYFYNVSSITKVQAEEKRYNNWKQSVYNTERTLVFFSNSHLDKRFAKELEFLKYKQKKLAGNLVYNTKYAKEWFKTFPSSHTSFVRLKNLTFNEKLKYLIVIIFSYIKSLFR